MIIGKSKGYISHPYLQFLAGHKGDIEARCSTNKGRLPPEMVEDMRAAYERCRSLLETKDAEAPPRRKSKRTRFFLPESRERLRNITWDSKGLPQLSTHFLRGLHNSKQREGEGTFLGA